MDFRNVAAAQGSKGLRNNNPGNFRTGVNWQGAVGDDGTGFIVFSDDTYGLRAMALNLYNNYYIDGLTTLTEFINKYAPSADSNNPAAYAASVAAYAGIGVNDDMQLDANMTALIMRGMMNEELGQDYSAMVSDDDIATGISMVSQFNLVALKTFGPLIGAVENNPVTTAVIVSAVALGSGAYIYFVVKKKQWNKI